MPHGSAEDGTVSAQTGSHAGSAEAKLLWKRQAITVNVSFLII